MPIFQSLFNSRDKPKNYLLGSAYSFFFGGTISSVFRSQRKHTREGIELENRWLTFYSINQAKSGLKLA